MAVLMAGILAVNAAELNQMIAPHSPLLAYPSRVTRASVTEREWMPFLHIANCFPFMPVRHRRLNPVEPYATGLDYDATLDDPLRAGRRHAKGVVEFRGALLAATIPQPPFSGMPILPSGEGTAPLPTVHTFDNDIADGNMYKV